MVVPRMKSTLCVLAALLCRRITRATRGSVTVRPAVVTGWSRFYFSTVRDDSSRYVIAWKL